VVIYFYSSVSFPPLLCKHTHTHTPHPNMMTQSAGAIKIRLTNYVLEEIKNGKTNRPGTQHTRTRAARLFICFEHLTTPVSIINRVIAAVIPLCRTCTRDGRETPRRAVAKLIFSVSTRPGRREFYDRPA